MTRVLVTWSSRHGSTDEIARTIAGVLAERGIEVEERPISDVDTMYPYDAYIVGSAVYMGKWLREARTFLDEHHELLATRPTWLFSSGPLGVDEADEFDGSKLAAAVNAQDHRVFRGRLQRSQLRLGERIVARVVGAPEGDYRDWPVVTAWATAVARTLEEAGSKRTRTAV